MHGVAEDAAARRLDEHSGVAETRDAHGFLPCRTALESTRASPATDRAGAPCETDTQSSNSPRMSSAVSACANSASSSMHGPEQARLALLQRHHLLLDRAGRDQPVDHDGAGLPDAVRAVDRLRLGRRVPPRVEQEDVVGLGEGEPEAARLEADEEHRRVARRGTTRSPRPRSPRASRRGTRSGMPRCLESRRDEARNDVNWLKTRVRWPSATISSQLLEQRVELARARSARASGSTSSGARLSMRSSVSERKTMNRLRSRSSRSPSTFCRSRCSTAS